MKTKATIVTILMFVIILFCVAACSDSNDNNANTLTDTIETEIITDSQSAAVSSDIVTLATSDVTSITTEELEIIAETIGSTEVDETNDVVVMAEAMVGIPFADGGSNPTEGFDNSGFIYYVLRENGYINCPRMTADQSKMGENITMEELKAGDLVFFSTDNSGKADFGGIYIGGGKMIYSPMPEQFVKETDITTEYWVSTFATAVSLS